MMSDTHRRCRVFFFFQAEDGIRDYKVTGVQTCALPILGRYSPRHMLRRLSTAQSVSPPMPRFRYSNSLRWNGGRGDRESTRLDSSHLVISYAVFCLKKKKKCKQSGRIPYRHGAFLST